MDAMGKTGETLQTKIVRVDPRGLTLLEENARFMPAEQYQRLVLNIQRDGCLSSTPLVYRNKDQVIVLSGNHRTMAAIDAGLEAIDVMEILSPLTEDRMRAIQLSHNALNGKDQLNVLKSIWSKIDGVDAKEYAALSKQMIEDMERIDVPAIDARLNFEHISIMFLGEEKEEVLDVLQKVRKWNITGKDVWVEAIQHYDDIARAMEDICTRETIHNFATAILLMARYATEYLAWVDAGEVTLGHAQHPVEKGGSIPHTRCFEDREL